MTITIPSITIITPAITLPLWAAILIGYAAINFILWQFVVFWYGGDFILNGEDHLFLLRLNPAGWFFAWFYLLWYTFSSF